MQAAKLEPEKVFYYFTEISRIPHGSGNTKQIERYCLEFAKEQGLEAYHDICGNVVIFKEGTVGYEQSAPVILQGHLDMVCEKLPDCKKDMESEGIDIIVDGETLRAEGTTLGGDDGIAVAYILALLASEDIPHPPIEALLTTDEETGLKGAYGLDASVLKGRRLINIDSEDEGVLTVSCAGGVCIKGEIPAAMVSAEGMSAKRITVGGLMGGHSGIDINKNRKNALKVLGELLFELKEKIQIRIACITGGGRLNVIPSFAEAAVCLDMESAEEFDKIVGAFDDRLKKACAVAEPDAYVSVEPIQNLKKCTDLEGTEKILFALMQSPSGVRAMHTEVPDLVQTSVNLGGAEFRDGVLKLGFMVRSNKDTDKIPLMREIQSLIKYVDGTFEIEDNYPAWEYCPDSPLCGTMTAVYEEMYGVKPVINSIHAGLECGIFAEKIPGMDMVSIGPTMKNVHTPKEGLDIRSAERVWEYLLRVLKSLLE